MGNRYLMVVSIERLLAVERYRQSQQAAEATRSLRDPHRQAGPRTEARPRRGRGADDSGWRESAVPPAPAILRP